MKYKLQEMMIENNAVRKWSKLCQMQEKQSNTGRGENQSKRKTKKNKDSREEFKKKADGGDETGASKFKQNHGGRQQ